MVNKVKYSVNINNQLVKFLIQFIFNILRHSSFYSAELATKIVRQ